MEDVVCTYQGRPKRILVLIDTGSEYRLDEIKLDHELFLKGKELEIKTILSFEKVIDQINQAMYLEDQVMMSSDSKVYASGSK